MECNMLIDLDHEVQGGLWVDMVEGTYAAGLLCPWVSTFHPQKLPCVLEEGAVFSGAFNAGVKMVFSDGTAWMVRFPRKGQVHDDFMDEKVAMEVAALRLIHESTTIPVPKIQGWGPAASNPLGLGPFIMMNFIDGVSLSDLIKDPDVDPPTRLMREDVGDSDIEFIYRQFANFLLQLFKLDFDYIGSLPWPENGVDCHVLRSPLSFKAHSILQGGGVNTFGTALLFSFHFLPY